MNIEAIRILLIVIAAVAGWWSAWEAGRRYQARQDLRSLDRLAAKMGVDPGPLQDFTKVR